MRLGRRRARPATYAAIVDDRYLWVALDQPGAVALRGASAPVETDTSQPGHHGTRLDLVDLTPGRYPVDVDGAALRGPAVRTVGPGAALALERDDADRLSVVRRPPTAGATVRALRLRGERVEIDLDAGSELRLGATVVPVVDGTAVLTPAHLADVAPGELAVLVDGQPVRRRADRLVDPGAGALLPALHPAGATEALARLRWSAEATLVVRVLGSGS